MSLLQSPPTRQRRPQLIRSAVIRHRFDSPRLLCNQGQWLRQRRWWRECHRHGTRKAPCSLPRPDLSAPRIVRLARLEAPARPEDGSRRDGGCSHPQVESPRPGARAMPGPGAPPIPRLHRPPSTLAWPAQAPRSPARTRPATVPVASEFGIRPTRQRPGCAHRSVRVWYPPFDASHVLHAIQRREEPGRR